VERAYTSANTRASDPGSAQPRAGDDQNRTSGVGGNASGVGSSSGGDIDTDVIGLGTGGGLSQRPAGDPPGPDDTDGSARAMASGAPTKNKKGKNAGKVKGDVMDHGGGDIESTSEGRGAAAASRPARLASDQEVDDAFAGEVSADEASGQDSH
jgi:hypothetical protein